MATLFDRIVVAAWSDADAPTRGADSIWRASIDVRSGEVTCVNHATRHLATRALIAELAETAGMRVFLGFDFPLGFPDGYAERLLQPGATWRSVWTAVDEAVDDDEDNSNNRFDAGAALNARAGMSPGPFWGCPPDADHGSVRPTRPGTFAGLSEFRIAESRLAARGVAAPAVWQLAGRGATGGRMLLGLPLVRDLAERSGLSRRIRLWPFETGCTPEPTRAAGDAIVIGEVWPWSFEHDPKAHELPDAARAISTAQFLARADRAGSLGLMFDPDLRIEDVAAVERQEGWILGA
ncbi:MAG: cobalamin biosynthesis protein CbiG [Ilumatobacteraceae bacterium]